MTTVALYDGAVVSGDDWSAARGLHYGDGVFRTVRIHQGRCLDWSGQCAQLLADAAVLDLHPDAAALTAMDEEAAQLAQQRGDGVLKILLWRRARGRGYAPSSTATERLLRCGPAPRYPTSCWRDGIEAIDSAVTLATPHPVAGIKHLNRLEQVLASREWPPGVSEALMCDAAGRVICGTRSNLFWVDGGRLLTPQLDKCGVAGRMRARIMQLAQALGVSVEEVQAPRAMLDQAMEVFVTNSLIGIWPVRRLGQREMQAPGALTQRLMQTLAHPEMC